MGYVVKKPFFLYANDGNGHLYSKQVCIGADLKKIEDAIGLGKLIDNSLMPVREQIAYFLTRSDVLEFVEDTVEPSGDQNCGHEA